MSDTIEFYLDGACLCVVESSHAPDRGDLVNIRKITYRVTDRTYTIDYSGERHSRAACVITLGPLP